MPIQALVEDLRGTIAAFPGTSWASGGTDEEGEHQVAWVKFGATKSEAGWRTIEFISWLYTDMSRGGEHVLLFPTAPPPYLNEPGECLSFVLEVHADGDLQPRLQRVIDFVRQCKADYWAECAP